MERREFLKVSAAASLAALAGLQSECTPKEVVATQSASEYHKYGDGTVDQPFMNWSVDKIDEQTKKEILAEEPQAKDLNENRYYKPHWNVNGSWSKTENRNALISHLSGPNHGHKRSHLNTMSTDELQRLHDNDHDSRSTTRRRWFRR